MRPSVLFVCLVAVAGFGGSKSAAPKKQTTRRAVSAKKAQTEERSYIARQLFNEDGELRKINPYGLFGWAAIFGQVTPGALTAAARLGLWDPPPVNLFTDISNAAMEAGIAEGSVPKWRATMWAQDYWKDLIGQYYANGESAAFLTKAGGVCAEHADWCAGLTLPLPP